MDIIVLYYKSYKVNELLDILEGLTLKNFKIKICAFFICICMCISVLTGCSLFVKNTEIDNAKTAIKVGDTVITKEDLIEDYRRFYNQNSSYFMYYDDETIMNVFYDSVVSNKIILIEAQKFVDDGTLVITDEDIQEVWDNVFDYIYHQVDDEEEVVLSLKGVEEDDYPQRLKTDTSSTEKAYKYEAYTFEPVSVKIATGESYNKDNYKIDDEIVKLNEYILQYNDSDDEENKNMIDIPEEELAIRIQAYNKYISELQLSAKAGKKDHSASAVLKAEVERAYKSYFESMLYTKYQEYINSTTAGVEGKYENQFSDSVIAEKYRKLLNASKESNTVETSYVEVVTSTSNDSLILYHNDEVGDLYFTVQHILVKFDDETLETLKATDGYDVTKDALFREYYEQVRASIATEEYIKNMETSYRDEDGYTVKEDDGNGNMIESKIAIGDFTSDRTILGEYNTQLNQRLDDLHATDEYISMTEAEKKVADERVKTILFQEFSWKYSEDTGSLVSDKISGVLGFGINSKNNENGSLVKEFANGARELYEAYKNDTDGSHGIGATILPVVSDYGVHLMMLTGVYSNGEIVSTKKVVDTETVSKTDAEIVSDLKKAYVSNLTSESLYEYVYDMIKSELVGTSGTYFTDHKNALVKEYNESKNIKYFNKMSKDELTKAISA